MLLKPHNRKRLLRVIAFLIILVILGSILWKWMFPMNQGEMYFSTDLSALNAISTPNGGEINVLPGMKPYAEEDRLILSADLAAQLFTVTDKQNSMVWSSSPDTSADKTADDLNRRISASPITFSYTSNFRDQLTASLLNEDVSWTVFPIDHGLQIHYIVENLQLSFIIEMDLHQGGLRIRIPDEGIVEQGAASLTAIVVFPMFGAALQGEPGYMVIPDGSGAITYFNKSHLNYDNRGYEKWIYGSDPAFLSAIPPPVEKQIAIPVFGMVKPSGAYVQTMVQGESDAMVFVSPPGVLGSKYYRGGLEFAFRKSYSAKLDGAGNVIRRIERSRIRSNREIMFDFVVDDNVSYSHLAHAVKERLKHVWGVRTAQSDNTLLIRLFMGSSNKKNPGAIEAMTTFAEAEKIAEYIKQSGIDQFSLAIRGWHKGGYDGKTPAVFPAEAKFGGKAGLASLLEWGKRQGIRISLEDNLLDIFNKEQDGVKLRTEAVRQPNGQLYVRHPVKSTGMHDEKVKWQLLSPFVLERDWFRKHLEELKHYGIEAIDLSYVGDKLFSDYNPLHPIHRNETMKYYLKWMKELAAHVPSIGIYYGNAYAVQDAAIIVDVPQTTSNHYLLDEQVPFLQMIYHGRWNYYSEPVNLSSDPVREILRAVEYGAVPAFELTYQPTVRLKLTHYGHLFSSQYEDWLPEIKKAYDIWEHVLLPLRDQAIIDHRRMGEQVFTTTYGNGTTVWVNYSEERFVGYGNSIAPMSYAVERSGNGK